MSLEKYLSQHFELFCILMSVLLTSGDIERRVCVGSR